MKKIFYLFFALPLLMLASCNNDDDLAEVDFSVTASGVSLYENAFYTVQSQTEPVSIDQIAVKSLTDKSAGLTGVRYYLDGMPLFGTIEEPFSISINPANLQVGTHSLSITTTILQVDKTITQAAMNFPLVVVAADTDLPAGAPAVGTFTQTVTIQPKK